MNYELGSKNGYRRKTRLIAKRPTLPKSVIGWAETQEESPNPRQRRRFTSHRDRPHFPVSVIDFVWGKNESIC